MAKFLSVSYKTVICILMILFLYITIISTFYGIDDNLSPIIIIIGTITTFVLFKYINKKIAKLQDKKIKVIAIILSLLFFIGLLLIGLFLPISSVTDLSHIIEYVNRMFSEESLTIAGPYFSKYTNQIPLLIFVYGFTKIGNIFGCTNVLLMGTIFNSLFMAITGYFIYLIGKELKEPKTGLLALIFMMVNPIFYLYSSYFYTDTLCMPFAVIGLYLLIKCLKNINIKNKIILGILSGIFFCIGLKVRVVVIILLIAALGYILIAKKITHKLKIYLALFLGLIIGIIGFKAIEGYFNLDLDKNAAFPITHWIMMGLNEEYNGGYNAFDYNLTFNEETQEAKKEANIGEIKTRINNLGLTGLIKLEGVKIARTWSSGNYGVYAKLNNTSDGTGLYEYLGGYGNTNIFLKYILQILKTYISFMILLGTYQIFRKKKIDYNYDAIIYIGLFGALIFYMIWEAAQRYSLCFLPWMIIPLGLIYSNINEKKEISMEKKYKNRDKILSLILMLITLILLTINFPKYVLDKNIYEDIRVLSYRGFTELEINNTISQTFRTSDIFNQIKIHLNNKNEQEESIYLFRLYNDNDKILVEEEFNSKDIKNDSNHLFKFAKINPTSNASYRLEISRISGAAVLSINTYNESKYYKVYNNGYVSVNGQETSDTFIFRVDYRYERAYMSIVSYLILSALILGIEWISLKEYIINSQTAKVLEKKN